MAIIITIIITIIVTVVALNTFVAVVVASLLTLGTIYMPYGADMLWAMNEIIDYADQTTIWYEKVLVAYVIMCYKISKRITRQVVEDLEYEEL